MEENTAEPAYLSRIEAVEYLYRKYGALGRINKATLARLACLGGGPTYYKVGNRVGYLPADLDAWHQSRCSKPLQKASDAGAIASTPME